MNIYEVLEIAEARIEEARAFADAEKFISAHYHLDCLAIYLTDNLAKIVIKTPPVEARKETSQ